MADDIDIEEHDVLDNPRIKNIFPDISSIKIEVPDYDEEIIDYEDIEENFDAYQDSIPQDDESDGSSLNLYPNKIILGTKVCSTPEHQYDLVPKLLQTSVVLENWETILNSSPCYCRSCRILFPTENALDSHKMSAHSFLIAVGRNKAVKSTTKSSVFSRLEIQQNLNGEENVCSHCNQVFPDEIALLKHSYELLPANFKCDFCDLVFDNETAFQAHKVIHNIECLCCKICTCHFKNEAKFISHMRIRHKMAVERLELVTTDYKCVYCGMIFKDNKYYNSHIGFRHPEFYNKVINKDDENKASKESTSEPSHSKKIQKLAKHEDSSDISSNENDFEQPVALISKTGIRRRAIPKSTLFKCNKCQIYFIFCSVAIEHEKRCVLKKGDWKCKQCRRSFKQADRISHLQQHKLTDRFKIIKASEDVLHKLLYKCTSCAICFDEESLMKYHAEGCSDGSYELCTNSCNSRIHERAIDNHNGIHNELGVDSFINVDIVCVEQIQTNNLKSLQHLETLSRFSEVQKKRSVKENIYYYCPSCQCFTKINKAKDKHYTGKCNKKLAKCLCKLCGLRFTKKSYATHKNKHKKYPNLKLRDLSFENIQTGDKITPPFPYFRKCSTCSVHFFSFIALKNHMCNVEEATNCRYCGEKFSDLAYKLHVSFHEYPGAEKRVDKMPEIIKKYESLTTIWNILFLCETCDTVLDSYDDVVEHCQDHFCNMESYNVSINHCSICDLKFLGISYVKHKKLHSANSITKTSFKILSYNYDNLLSESWNDMFNTLAKAQVDQILNKSKYKYMRCIRIELLKDGPINFTLYQCDMCKVIVDWNAVAEHTQNRQCIKAIKYHCTKCPLKFATKNSLIAHGYMHSTCTIDDKSMRILSFNSEGHLYVNDSLRSKMNPESLKFIRCNICGKLINKAKYRKHVDNHKYTLKRSKLGKGPKLLIRPKYKKVNTPQTHNFYKCRSCGVCLLRALNIPRHFCSSKTKKKQCLVCSLWFRSTQYPKHVAYHENHKVNKNDINIIYFKNGKIEKTRPKDGHFVLYQCVECNVCLHNEFNTKRHVCMKAQFQKECNICHMPFHGSHLNVHLKHHKERSRTNKNLHVIQFKQKKIISSYVKELPKYVASTSKVLPVSSEKDSCRTEFSIRDFNRYIHNRIFKCRKCKLLFVTPSAMISHQNSCKNNSKGVKCDKCQLVFHPTHIDLHEMRQKLCGGIDILYFITLKTDGLEYNEDKSFYFCIKCNVCFPTFRAILHHIQNDHVIRIKTYKCKICNIKFTPCAFRDHKACHARENLTLEDFVHFEVEDMSLQKALKDLPNNKLIVPKPKQEVPLEENKLEFDDDIKEKIAKQNIKRERETLQMKGIKRKLREDSTTPKKAVKIETPEVSDSEISMQSPNTNNNTDNQLFNCNVCDLNFLHKRTLKFHLFKGTHDEVQHKCPLCKLNFTQNSLTRHLRLQCVRSKTDTDQDKLVTETSYVNNDRLADTQSNTSSNNHTNKLFKCSTCDVYFLHRDACSDHVTNHLCLDPTEYIACKICDLQYLCENLGAHMKSHREKVFSIDDLIIEEYQFNYGKIHIDTYSAADRLKSKAVSTTTHFEMEDSTVDSTVSVESRSNLSISYNTQ